MMLAQARRETRLLTMVRPGSTRQPSILLCPPHLHLRGAMFFSTPRTV